MAKTPTAVLKGIQYKKKWGHLISTTVSTKSRYQRRRCLAVVEFAADQEYSYVRDKGLTEVYQVNNDPFQSSNAGKPVAIPMYDETNC